MPDCEDCGETVTYRRRRCSTCGFLVCRWCYHHVHAGLKTYRDVIGCPPTHVRIGSGGISGGSIRDES
jgi:hypothetical protein